MAVVPSTRGGSAGGVLSTTAANTTIYDPVDFLLAPPRAELRQLTAQTLTTGVWTSITFDAEDLDDNFVHTAQHDTVTNNSRFTAVYPGWYHCAGGVSFAANVTGRRGCRWAVNGVGLNGCEVLLAPTPSGVCQVPARGKLVFLNFNDYVEIQGFQESGGNLLTSIVPGQQSNASIVWKSN